jgi:hypothetical protein
VILDLFKLFWQLFALGVCSSGLGLGLRYFIPQNFSAVHKMLFCFIGGLFLVVLVAENLFYLGVPVRISAWLLMGATLVQAWFCRHKFITWRRALYLDADIRALPLVVLLTIGFHGIAPIRQGLESYYGKAYPDQLNYVVLAEFLKDESYKTSQEDIGTRPWLLRIVGFQESAKKVEGSNSPAPELVGLKKERIGQSIITAAISVWSGTDAKGGYSATVIFFFATLAICVYVLLRESGTDRFTAGSGALLAVVLPALTRLSLNGFLSQVATLFLFPFFAILLRRRDLSARGFTLFFSLSLAYLIAAYSEIAPIGFGVLFLGVLIVRSENFRLKRFMLMSAVLLIALLNICYLPNLIVFLVKQFYIASNDPSMENLMPRMLTLRGWSEVVFGVVSSPAMALLFDYLAIVLGLLFLVGAILLSRRDRLVFGVVLLPVIAVILSLATWSTHAAYPVAKITLSILPILACPVFVALSRTAAYGQAHLLRILKTLFSALIVVAAATGSFHYYGEVLNNDGLLRYVREPRFLEVCRKLDGIRNKRVIVFETYPLLTLWLCYHARQNDVYYDARSINDAAYSQLFPFLKIPDLQNVDFVVVRDRIIDLKAPNVACLSLVGDTPGEDWADGHFRYGLGPPIALRLLAFRSISATICMQLGPGSEATAFPITYSLVDDDGHISQGEIWSKNMDVRRISFPRGLSRLRLSVKPREGDPNAEQSFPILAELEEFEIRDIR